MRRLAGAVRDGGRSCVIVGLGSMFRIRFSQRLFYRRAVGRAGGVPVSYCPALAVPGLTSLLQPFLVITHLLRLHRTHRVQAFIGYCYYPSTLLAALVARFVLGANVIFDVEDICEPSWKDWLARGDARPMQQAVGYLLLRVACCVSHAVIVPSALFLPFIRPTRRTLVVTGCMENEPGAADLSGQRGDLRILFSGKLEEEHGIRLLVAAINLLDEQGGVPLRFDICGSGSLASWVGETCKRFQRHRVVYHGFVSNQKFSELLACAEVAVVLQDPSGRHAVFKTPSKAYEAMCAGLAVIVTDVGDFASLPGGTCLVLSPNTPERLAELLRTLTRERVAQIGATAQRYAAEQWRSEAVGKRICELLEA